MISDSNNKDLESLDQTPNSLDSCSTPSKASMQHQSKIWLLSCLPNYHDPCLLINYIKLGKIGGLERGGGDIVERGRGEFLNHKPRERNSMTK